MKGIHDNSGFFSDDDLSVYAHEGRNHLGYIIGKSICVSESGFCEVIFAKKGGRLFVLKALKPEHRMNPVALASLEKEFEITFSLDIHGVSNTFDFIDHPEKGKCIVLKYYTGSNLLALIENGYLFSDKELNTIWHSLIYTVKEIHRRGIVHRDIKPSNIMYDPQTGEVTLIDFGCADTYDQLHFKGLAGTPFYMPEKDAGTPAADWYALLKVFEEICTTNNVKSFQRRINYSLKRLEHGQPPFEDSKSNGNWKKRILIVSTVSIGLLLAAILLFFPRNRDEVLEKSAGKGVEYRIQLKSEALKNKDSVTLTDDSKTFSTPADRSHTPHRTERLTTTIPTTSSDQDSLEMLLNSRLDIIVKSHTEDIWWEAAKAASKIWHNQTLTEEEKKRRTLELINEDEWCSEVIALCQEELKEITPMPDRDKIESLVHQRYRRQCKYFEQVYGVRLPDD